LLISHILSDTQAEVAKANPGSPSEAEMKGLLSLVLIDIEKTKEAKLAAEKVLSLFSNLFLSFLKKSYYFH